MRLTRWNGEYWHHDDRNILRRVAGWFVWAGGWHAHSPKAPWSTRRLHAWTRLKPDMLAPVSFFGHRFTYFGWGAQWRVKGAYWVYVRPGAQKQRQVYRSSNGTPSDAHIWIVGAPPDVRTSADDQMARRARWAEERRREVDAIQKSTR